MSEKTAIRWTEATWNPWIGCTRVSPGCAHCYMFTGVDRYGGNPAVVRRSKTKFGDPLKWKEPKLIFTCSWSDWFHEAADEWRPEAWEVIRATPQHTYQILTKRPENIRERLPKDWGDAYRHVWLGTSAENQRFLDIRLNALMQAGTGARVHFISCEPLLGPIDLDGWLTPLEDQPICRNWINWVIVGGESGPGFRPMNPDWARSIRDQCKAAGVAFFYKQGSAYKTEADPFLDGVRYEEMPR